MVCVADSGEAENVCGEELALAEKGLRCLQHGDLGLGVPSSPALVWMHLQESKASASWQLFFFMPGAKRGEEKNLTDYADAARIARCQQSPRCLSGAVSAAFCFL